MKLFCPECGAQISADDMNLTASTAKCRQCNSVFAFDPTGAESRSAIHPTLTPTNVAMLPVPGGLRVDDFGGTWAASWRWFTPTYLFILFFCIAWDSFLIFWYSMALGHNAPWIMVIFPIAHVAVGVFLTYTVAAGFLNHTRIEVSGGAITVSHGPLPWPGNRTIATTDIQQLYCERTIASASDNRGAATPRFQLSAVLRDGTKLPLLKGFDVPDKPTYLERQLERLLHITNRPVVGEFHG